MSHEKIFEPQSQVTGVTGDVESWTVSRELSGGSGPWTPGGLSVGGGQLEFKSGRTPWTAPAITTDGQILIEARADTSEPFSRIATMTARTVSADSALFESRSMPIADDLGALKAPMPTAPSMLPTSPVDASQAIVEVCLKAGVPHDVEASGIMVPALILQGRTGWEIIQQVAELTLGAAWMSETGVLVYRNAASMRGIGTPKETITPAHLEDLPWELSDEDVADRATVTYTPTVVETVSDYSLTLWEVSDVVEVPASGTVVLEQSLEVAAGSLAPWKSIFDTSAPTNQYSRWNAGFQAEGGDPAPNNALTITSTLLSASRVRVTITNNLAVKLYLSEDSALVVRANKRASLGAPVTLETGASEDTARNTASLDVGTFLASEAKARELLGWLAQQASVPRKTLTQVNVVPDPARRLGDLVLVKEPSTGVDSRVLITGITTSSEAGRLSQQLTLTLVDGVVPAPPPVGVKITDPVGTSNSGVLAERQAVRDLRASTSDLTDTTPPPAPSAPTLTARLGVISVSYDGKSNTGGSMPSRVERIEVGFGPATSPTDVVDSIAAAGGISLIGDQPYQQNRFVRLRAVNYSGVAGPWGDERSIAVTPLVNTDLIGKVIEEANLGNNTVTARTIVAEAVTSAKIAALAVEAGHIAVNAITADKIDAGAVTGVKIAADAIDGKTITGAILRTAASGQRVQIDSTGLRAFNSGGTAVTTISASTGAITAAGADITGSTITGGTVRTAASGQRVQLDSVGLRAFNSTGVPVTTIHATTGQLNATNAVLSGQITTTAGGYTTTLAGGSLTSTYPLGRTKLVGNVFLYENTAGQRLGALQYSETMNTLFLDAPTGKLSIDAGSTVEVHGSTAVYLGLKGSNIVYAGEDSTGMFARFPQSYSRTYGMSAGTSGNRLAILTDYGTLGTLTGAAHVPSTLGTGGDITSGGRVIANTTIRSIGYESTSASASCVMTSGGWLQRSTSVRAAKLCIEDLDIDGLAVTRALRPRTWHDKASAERLADALAREAAGEEVDWDFDVEMGRIPGFVAEEVAEIDLPAGFVTRDTDGNLTGVAYDRIPAIHTIAIQQMADQIDALIERVNQLEGAA